MSSVFVLTESISFRMSTWFSTFIISMFIRKIINKMNCYKILYMSLCIKYICKTGHSVYNSSRLGSVMVSVLAIRPKIEQVQTQPRWWTFKSHKNPHNIFLQRGRKARGPRHKILRHVKELYKYEKNILYTKPIISFAHILLISY
jgi:hypothetical protein